MRESKIRALGVTLICAKLALVPLVADHASDVPFVVPKALLSHAIAYAVAGVIVGLLVRYGPEVLGSSRLHIPVLFFLGVNAAATVVAADATLALYGAHVRMLGLGTIADLVVLYFAVVVLIRTRRDVVAVMICGLGASLVVLVYEGVQLAGKDPWRWSMDGSLRPFSTIGQPTSLAEYLTVLAVGTFAIGLLAAGIRRPWRALLMIYSGVLVAGMGATGTRSGLVGLVVGSTVLVGLIWALHPNRRARLLSIAAAAVAAATVAVLLILSPLGSRLATSFELPSGDESGEELLARFEPTADTRAALYAIALDMVHERPLLGWGPDNFAIGVPRYRFEGAPYEVRQSLATSPHGWLTQVVTNSGIMGLTAFLLIPLVALTLTLKRGYRPLSVAGMTMIGAYLGTGLTTVNDVPTDSLFWVAVGMIAASTSPGLAGTENSAHRPTTRARQRAVGNPDLRAIGAIVSVAAGLLLSLTTISPLEASQLAEASQQSRLQGRASEAITLATRAVGADPRRAEYSHTLGLAYVAGSRMHDATTTFERAARLAPYEVRYLGDLARAILLDTSASPATRAHAIEVAEQAVRIDPNNPLANLTRAVVMQATGNLQEARRSIERSLALDPQSSNRSLYATGIEIYLALTQNYLASGDMSGALTSAERALTVHPRPTDARVYLNASQVYRRLGRPLDAIRTAREGLAAVTTAGDMRTLRVELARGLAASGESSAALSELDAVLAIEPNDPSAQQLRAEIQAGLTRQ